MKKIIMPNSAFNTLDECLGLNNKTINTITNEELNYFDNMVFNQIFERNRCYIFDMNEMLNSHSAEILIKLLKDLFGEYIIGSYVYNDELPKFANNSTMFDIYVTSDVIDLKTEYKDSYNTNATYYSTKLKLKEFESIIQSYQYFITLVTKNDGKFCISCEPKFTDKVDLSNKKYGYHIILKTDEKEKASLEDKKEEIVETLVEELKSTDKTLSINALVELRKDYGMNIEDDEIAKQYSTYIANQLLSANSSN